MLKRLNLKNRLYPLLTNEVHKSRNILDILISSEEVKAGTILLLNKYPSSSAWPTPVYSLFRKGELLVIFGKNSVKEHFTFKHS